MAHLAKSVHETSMSCDEQHFVHFLMSDRFLLDYRGRNVSAACGPKKVPVANTS